MTLAEAMRDPLGIGHAFHRNDGELIEVLERRDISPIPRQAYRLLIHQPNPLGPIDLVFAALDLVEDDLKVRRPNLDWNAWQQA